MQNRRDHTFVGVNSFSEELGDDAAALSQLWDQLALLQFIQARDQ